MLLALAGRSAHAHPYRLPATQLHRVRAYNRSSVRRLLTAFDSSLTPFTAGACFSGPHLRLRWLVVGLKHVDRCQTCAWAGCEDCLPDDGFHAIGENLPEFELLGFRPVAQVRRPSYMYPIASADVMSRLTTSGATADPRSPETC
jgi:hypothetical protein